MLTVSTSKSKTTYHHGDLREALLAAALDILEEGGGTAALTLRETARRAGVSAMAPYRHFADKEALLAGVATIGYERFGAALRAADSHADPHEALIAQGVAYVVFAQTHPALFRLMFGATSPEPSCDLAEAGDEAYAVLTSRVASVAPDSQARDWSLLSWCTVHGLALLALDGKLGPYGEPAPVLADRVLRLLAVTRAP